MGVPRDQDPNESDGETIGYTPATIHRGRRWSANDAFLKPARARANLTVVTDTDIHRISFDERRACGVEGMRNGEPVTYRTAGEVILCTGALISPKLLQLSGIGPADLLRGFGIPVIADSPGVGRHMLEHKMITMQVRLKRDLGHNRKLKGMRLIAEAARYFATGGGVLGTTYDLNGFIKTDPALDRPDAQITFWSLSTRRDLATLALEDEPGLTVMGYPARTTSEGSIMIRSADPRDPPMIRTNFLQSEHDQRIIIALFRFMRRIFAHPLVAPFVTAETWPGPDVTTDDDILQASRLDGNCQHAVGTCRMGDAPDAVVDARLRVNGVTNLRVMDCSVLPGQVTGNTNGPVMAMAWRASQMILEDFKYRNTAAN